MACITESAEHLLCRLRLNERDVWSLLDSKTPLLALNHTALFYPQADHYELNFDPTVVGHSPNSQ